MVSPSFFRTFDFVENTFVRKIAKIFAFSLTYSYLCSMIKKVVCYFFLMLLLLTTGATNLWAEEQLPPKLQKLTEEAYRCYSARETDYFFEAVKRVKDAAEFSDYQETYYRACSYEAIYMFESALGFREWHLW